jgi:hypothetical protein
MEAANKELQRAEEDLPVASRTRARSKVPGYIS